MPQNTLGVDTSAFKKGKRTKTICNLVQNFTFVGIRAGCHGLFHLDDLWYGLLALLIINWLLNETARVNERINLMV